MRAVYLAMVSRFDYQFGQIRKALEDGGLYEASIEVATLNNGGLNLFWTESDLWKVRPGTHDFKIIAIQANVYKDRSDVDYSNYEAVKTAFQLAD